MIIAQISFTLVKIRQTNINVVRQYKNGANESRISPIEFTPPYTNELNHISQDKYAFKYNSYHTQGTLGITSVYLHPAKSIELHVQFFHTPDFTHSLMCMQSQILFLLTLAQIQSNSNDCKELFHTYTGINERRIWTAD